MLIKVSVVDDFAYFAAADRRDKKICHDQITGERTSQKHVSEILLGGVNLVNITCFFLSLPSV